MNRDGSSAPSASASSDAGNEPRRSTLFATHDHGALDEIPGLVRARGGRDVLRQATRIELRNRQLIAAEARGRISPDITEESVFLRRSQMERAHGRLLSEDEHNCPERFDSSGSSLAEGKRTAAIRLYLINPCNPLVSLTHVRESRWNRYRVWKPLGLLALAALTPPECEITIFDENMRVPDYGALPRPDLVGVTAFTAQANRAYEIATEFRSRDVPVVMGGIHATMRPEEAMARVDAVVTGEAEPVWAQVLSDVRIGALQRLYAGAHADMDEIPPARHDLLSGDYAFGAIQTTRGCPLNCSFCSVTAFNGYRYRQRPIANVVREFGAIREKRVLVVDDNLIGTSRAHIERTKELFRAMIRAKLGKQWIAQVTINMADDDELLTLAAKAGCAGVFIGFESPSAEGLREVGKKFNLLRGRDFASSVRRIQRHKILVAGSFIIGLDADEPGIGKRIAAAARRYGVDVLNTLFLTPLPGTRLWDELEANDRIAADTFPEDWKYYTLTFPVARYMNLSRADIAREMETCDETFYSVGNILRRVWSSLGQGRKPLIALVANLSYRRNLGFGRQACREFLSSHAQVEPVCCLARASKRAQSEPRPAAGVASMSEPSSRG